MPTYHYRSYAWLQGNSGLRGDGDHLLEDRVSRYLIPPNSPSDVVRVAFIVENGAPIELLEFADPNHPGRRQQSEMLI
jgi:hypothetical protein